jgi:NAD(P)-dependent dehydrogenase (short-subunit alcohol dehydrogenase family)
MTIQKNSSPETETPSMFNPMDLTGRSLLVTGASSGIGRSTAILLSRLGAKLILVARDGQRLEETRTQLQGEEHRCVQFDLTGVDDIPQLLKKICAETGPLTGVVHSAGLQLTKGVRFLNRNDVDALMTINVTAALGLARGFRQKGVFGVGGSLVFLTSTAGLVGVSGMAAYSATKGALIALTRSLAMELAPEGIRVNCVAPGLVHTEMVEQWQQPLTQEQVDEIERMHPMGIGKPNDVANAIAFLLADTGRWITGTTLVVDGGLTAH